MNVAPPWTPTPSRRAARHRERSAVVERDAAVFRLDARTVADGDRGTGRVGVADHDAEHFAGGVDRAVHRERRGLAAGFAVGAVAPDKHVTLDRRFGGDGERGGVVAVDAAVERAVRDDDIADVRLEDTGERLARTDGRVGYVEAAEVDDEILANNDRRVDDRVVEQLHRVARRSGRDGGLKARVGGCRSVGHRNDRRLGRGLGVGRRVGDHRAVVGGESGRPLVERVDHVVRDVAGGIGVRRDGAPVDGRRVGRVGAVGGLVVPRDRVVAVDGLEDREVGRVAGGAGQLGDHAAALRVGPAEEVVAVRIVLGLDGIIGAGPGHRIAGQDLGGRGRALDVPRDREGVLVPGRPVGDGAGRAGGDRRLDARGDVVRPAVERVALAAGREERDRQGLDRVGIRERVRDGVRRAGKVEVPHDRVLEEADGVGRDIAGGARLDGVARGHGRGEADAGALGEGALLGVDLDDVADGEVDRAGDVVREEVEGPDAGLVGGGETVGRGGVGHVAHGGLEGHVVFGDDGRLHAVGVGEADAVDLLGLVGLERLHRNQVISVRGRARARAGLIERDALDVVAGGAGLDVEDDQEVVRRVGGGIDAGELDPSVHALRSVTRVGVERGSLVARELRDREAGAGRADALGVGQLLHRALGDLEAGLDADHLIGGGRGQFLVDALHALGEIGDGVERVRRDIEPLGLALRVEAAGQRGIARGERPVDGLVPGQAREGRGRAGDRDRDAGRVGGAVHRRAVGRDGGLDLGAGRAAREDGRGECRLGEGERRDDDRVLRELRGVNHARGDDREVVFKTIRRRAVGPAGECVGVALYATFWSVSKTVPSSFFHVTVKVFSTCVNLAV